MCDGQVASLSLEMFVKQMRAAATAGNVKHLQGAVAAATAESREWLHRERFYKLARFGWAASLDAGYHFLSPGGFEIMLIPHKMWCELLREAV